MPIFLLSFFDTSYLGFRVPVISAFVAMLLGLIAIALLVFLLVTCIVHCRRMNIPVDQLHITENPVTLVCRVT